MARVAVNQDPGDVAEFTFPKPVIAVGVAGPEDCTNQICTDFWVLLQRDLTITNNYYQHYWEVKNIE